VPPKNSKTRRGPYLGQDLSIFVNIFEIYSKIISALTHFTPKPVRHFLLVLQNQFRIDLLYSCAADAAFRAVQLKVAITRWLRLHQKEGLYQEEKITARISGRSHLIKEKEAKNYNSLCVGGGGAARWLPKRPPSPKWRVGRSKRRVYSPPPTWGPAKMTRQGPARDPPGTRHLSRD
jgi:hypothetical protein